eukprot:m.14850 g.14850  ORF g.14850 m.14850 type:complete len:619 (+) comp2981_c0_seq1:68-1924(+)
MAYPGTGEVDYGSDGAASYRGSESLYAVPTATIAAMDSPHAGWDPTQFFGAFWTRGDHHHLDDGFEELKKYLRQGNEFCKDIIEIMKERAALEDQYAKKLQGLYAKSLKVAENTFGSLKTAWNLVLGEFKDRAEWHLSTCEVIKRSVCDPLSSFKDQQRKDHKAIQANVEKSLKSLLEINGLVAKLKRTAHIKSKEAEVANIALDEAKQAVGRTVAEKDMARLQKAVIGAERMRDKADSAYRDSMDKAVNAQEDWESAMITGCKALQRSEEERINTIKRMLMDYAQRYVGQLQPMEQCFQNMTQFIQAVSAPDDCVVVSKERGTGPFVAVQQLYDCYEQNIQMHMERTRRRNILVDKLDLFRQEAQKRDKMRVGLSKMWEATRDSVRDGKGDPQALFAVTRQLATLDYVTATAYANQFQLRCSLSDLTGTARPVSALVPMIERVEDKGIFNSTLRLPSTYRVDPDALRTEAEKASQADQSFGQPMTAASRRQSNAAGMAQARAAARANTGPPSSAAPTRSMSQAHAPAPYQPQQPAPLQAQYLDETEDFPPPPPAPTPGSRALCRCRALYNYDPAEEDELRLRVGDELDVYDNSDETWWQGALRGVVGIFPAAYVQVL